MPGDDRGFQLFNPLSIDLLPELIPRPAPRYKSREQIEELIASFNHLIADYDASSWKDDDKLEAMKNALLPIQRSVVNPVSTLKQLSSHPEMLTENGEFDFEKICHMSILKRIQELWPSSEPSDYSVRQLEKYLHQAETIINIDTTAYREFLNKFLNDKTPIDEKKQLKEVLINQSSLDHTLIYDMGTSASNLMYYAMQATSKEEFVKIAQGLPKVGSFYEQISGMVEKTLQTKYLPKNYASIDKARWSLVKKLFIPEKPFHKPLWLDQMYWPEVKNGLKDVHYLRELERYRVDISDDGLLMKDEKLLDTENSAIGPTTTDFRFSRVLFVMDTNKNIYIYDFKNPDKPAGARGGIHHSSFTHGGPVICAGSLQVENGKIVEIRGDSGHYRPREEHLKNLYQVLKNELHCQVFTHENKEVDVSEAASSSFKR